jgi:hypothetical protein
VGSVAEYLTRGPGFIFLFHPALGPLWDVAAQKLRGGSLAPRSELVLEVAEVHVEQLHLQVGATQGEASWAAAVRLSCTSCWRCRTPRLLPSTCWDQRRVALCIVLPGG